MKQTLAILTEGKNSEIDWIGLFKGRNCKLLICTNCTEERNSAEENNGNGDVSYQPCAKDAAWEADLLLIETGLTPLSELLPRLSAVAANKIVIIFSVPATEEEAIAEIIVQGLPYSTIGLLKFEKDDFFIQLINDHNLVQASTILNDLNFPFTDKLKINEQNYQN